MEQRQLLFRAYDKHLGRFLCEGFSIIGEVTIFNGLQEMIAETPIEGISGLQRLLDLHITQYTGIDDKSGVKIFEGDIIQWSTTRYKSCYEGHDHKEKNELITLTWKSPVEWEGAGFVVTESFELDQKNNCWLAGTQEPIEIIGNIYKSDIEI